MLLYNLTIKKKFTKLKIIYFVTLICCWVFPEHFFKSSHQRCSVRKHVLRNFTKFTGKRLCQSLFFNKVAGLRSATLLKKRLWHRRFLVNFVKFLRTPFSWNTSGWLLLLRAIPDTHLAKLKIYTLTYFILMVSSIPPENIRKLILNNTKCNMVYVRS